MFFKKIKIMPIELLVYELDCTKYNGFFCSTREQWLANKLKIKNEIKK